MAESTTVKIGPDQRAAQIANNFTYHAPKPSQIPKYEIIRERAKEFATELTLLCPSSRELSLAITELETVAFWANAAIARNE
jgi:hypothetical protein